MTSEFKTFLKESDSEEKPKGLVDTDDNARVVRGMLMAKLPKGWKRGGRGSNVIALTDDPQAADEAIKVITSVIGKMKKGRMSNAMIVMYNDSVVSVEETKFATKITIG